MAVFEFFIPVFWSNHPVFPYSRGSMRWISVMMSKGTVHSGSSIIMVQSRLWTRFPPHVGYVISRHYLGLALYLCSSWHWFFQSSKHVIFERSFADIPHSSIASYPWLSVEHLKATELYTRKHRIAEKIDRVWENMHRPHGQIFFSCYQSCWNWQVWHASVGNWWLDCLSLGSDKLPVDHLPRSRRRLSAKSGDAEPNYTGNIWNDRFVGRRKRPLGASFQVAL